MDPLQPDLVLRSSWRVPCSGRAAGMQDPGGISPDPSLALGVECCLSQAEASSPAVPGVRFAGLKSPGGSLPRESFPGGKVRPSVVLPPRISLRSAAPGSLLISASAMARDRSPELPATRIPRVTPPLSRSAIRRSQRASSLPRPPRPWQRSARSALFTPEAPCVSAALQPASGLPSTPGPSH